MSADHFRCGLLGIEVVEFAGGHVGCTEHPEEFGRRLLAVLDPKTGSATPPRHPNGPAGPVRHRA